MTMINEEIAKMFSDDDCQEGCEGTGVVVVSVSQDGTDSEERYCSCVMNNKADAEANKQED